MGKLGPRAYAGIRKALECTIKKIQLHKTYLHDLGGK